MVKVNPKKPQKDYVSQFKNIICLLLFIYFFLLFSVFILKRKTFNTFDSSLVYITFFTQIISLYSCFVKWNANLLMYTHYLFVVMLYVVLMSKNVYLLSFYLLVVIGIIIGWKLNNDKCVFDKLNWDIEFMGIKYSNKKKTSKFMIYILMIMYPLKIWYSKK